MTLPSDPLDLVLALKHAHPVKPCAGSRRVQARIEDPVGLLEAEVALDAVGLLISHNAPTKILEWSLPAQYYRTLEEVLARPSNRSTVPDRFYVEEDDYLSSRESELPTLIDRYVKACKLLKALINAADHSDWNGSRVSLVFLHTEKLVISDEYGIADLVDLPSSDEFIAEFLTSKEHASQKKIILRVVLAELFKGQNTISFASLLTKFGEFASRVGSSYLLYVSEFSFTKIKTDLEKDKLEFVSKLNKVFSDIQNQLLAIPAALILVGSQLGASGHWTLKNALIWMGAFVFAALMDLLVRNQKNTLMAIKQEIDAQWALIKGDHGAIAPQFVGIYEQLDRRYRWQCCLLASVSMLVAVALGASTGLLLWHTVTFSLFEQSVLVGLSAGMAVWIVTAFYDWVWGARLQEMRASKSLQRLQKS
jgi:hypothetical protein